MTMKRLTFLPMVCAALLCGAGTVSAAPAWGGNCLACHDDLMVSTLQVTFEDFVADPDESGTGAPDRGPLKVFQVAQGESKSLIAEVDGLDPDDRYAVQIKRLRFDGVESGGSLVFMGDCAWPEWGDTASYFTEPLIAHVWGTGPTIFSFDIDVEVGTRNDYYDLVFALAGKYSSSGELFYAEEHFYLRVYHEPGPGDVNEDAQVNLDDYAVFQDCMNGPDNSTPPPACTPVENFDACDLDDDEDVDLDDFAAFAGYLAG
jgi:hypothetical protein